MGRLLAFIISFGVLCGIAYWYVTGAGRPKDAEAPAETLQNVRETAKKLEVDNIQRANDIDHKTGTQ